MDTRKYSCPLGPKAITKGGHKVTTSERSMKLREYAQVCSNVLSPYAIVVILSLYPKGRLSFGCPEMFKRPFGLLTTFY